MTKPNRVQNTSDNFLGKQIERLREIFPQVFSDGKIDLGKLRETLGEFTDNSPERYSFSWAGKLDTIRLLQTPTRATLTPCPEESVDWDNTRNLFVEGDNLETLKLLLKPYYGQVKMIYIDPPYNTGNDFVYPDNYADPLGTYLQLTGQKDAEGNLQTSNPETSGRYHSAWLSMMYPRLFLARQLLQDDGVIFVSIDDKEVYNLRATLNIIFGEENFLGMIVWENATDNNPSRIAVEHEYICVYAKNINVCEPVWKSDVSDVKDVLIEIGNKLAAENRTLEELKEAYKIWFTENKTFLGPLDRYKYIDFDGVYTGSQSVHNPGKEGYRYDVVHPVTKKPCKQPLMGYRFPEDTMKKMLEDGVILFGDDENKIIEIKVYAKDYLDKLPSVLQIDGRLGSYDLKSVFNDSSRIFNNPKPVQLLNSFFPFILNDGDILLDFFAGSASSAQAIFELNKVSEKDVHFILIQYPEKLDSQKKEQKAGYTFCVNNNLPPTIAEIAKERIRRVIANLKEDTDNALKDMGFKVYKLAESNLRGWGGLEQTDGEVYAEQMEIFNDPLIEGWKPENIITEVALKEAGFSLNYSTEQVGAVTGQKIQRVTDPEREQLFFICLDNHIELEHLNRLELTKDELFICRASALDDDTAANLALQCRLKVI